jgi:hypothetical protein
MNKLPFWFERVEGVFLFLAATGLFLALHAHVWAFLVLFVAVDLSIAGYLAGPKVGAIMYNLFHTLTLPLLAAAIGLLSYRLVWLDTVALAWLAHIGADRALGFGLKYPDGFSHTTLGTIGRRRPAAKTGSSRKQ